MLLKDRKLPSRLTVGFSFAITIYAAYILTQSVVAAITSPEGGSLSGILSSSKTLPFLLVYSSMYLVVSIFALAIKNLVFKNLGVLQDQILMIGMLTGSGLLALLFSFQPILLVIQLVAILLLSLLGKSIFKNHSVAGVNFYLANNLMIVVGLIWGIGFVMTLHVSLMTRILLLASAPLLLIVLPSSILKLFEIYDIICREKWVRPRHPHPKRTATHEPFVSIHVPTYSEPPTLVIETLDKLAQLDYKNYEVIVIDNNTIDPLLWQPVEAHCRTLGPRFRFIHADKIDGAKGGALNYIIPLTDPRATLIGVMDADYHAEPEFLRALVGHFDDPKIGFVQTPHDYRGWRGNLYLTFCYWEYKIFFHSAMIALSERDAGITVGTMCLIRKEALEKAGGWSEWCVTEDSELAIRIHDVGFSSVYVDTTYGRGLIPDTFAGYKKQRYRWTAGPVQEFQYYLRHFFGISGQPTEFTLTQRLYHLNHGLDNVIIGLSMPLQFVGIALVLSIITHGEIIQVPFEMWLAATVMLVANPLLTFVMNMATVRPKVWEIFAQLFASKALSHIISYSAFRTTLTGNAAWHRTNKFKSHHSYLAALESTKEEALSGIALTVFVILAFIAFPHPGLSLMLLIGLSYMSLTYFCSPLMAILGVWSMKRSETPPNDLAFSHLTAE